MARRGFEMFADRLEAAFNDGRPSALSAFGATGRAYLAFARENPGYYIAMFESGVAIAGHSELAQAYDRAMGVLRRAAERMAAHLPADRRPPPGMVANHIWALSHGVGRALRPRQTGRPRALLRRGDARERHRDLPPRVSA